MEFALCLPETMDDATTKAHDLNEVDDGFDKEGKNKAIYLAMVEKKVCEEMLLTMIVLSYKD